ncbi:MAG: DUF502 domain-containing protein [Opitutaceae bacterium]
MPAVSSRLTKLRNAFLTGLALLAPLAVTFIVFSWLVDAIGGRFRPFFFFALPDTLRDHPSLSIVWNVLATLLVLCLVTLFGYVSRYVLGRFFGQLLERFVQSIPGVNAVYNTVKQIVGTFSAQNRNLFSKVVLIEFPRKGTWSLAFLTNRTQGEPQLKTAQEVWTVFVPTTPNPTSGFLIMLPRHEIMELDMSVGDGMKMIISGGAVVPPWPSPVAGETETAHGRFTASRS